MSCSDSLESLVDRFGAGDGLDNDDDIGNPYWVQSQGNISKVFGTGKALDNGLGNDDNLLQLYLDRQEASALQLGTPPSHAPLNPESMHIHPPPLAQQPASALQLGTPPSHPPLNPESMDVHPPPLAQQPGTSQPPNITNAADAAKREKIRESKRKSWVKKETERKEKEKLLAEVTKENGVLLEANARLEKEGGEAKVKLKSVEQELSYRKKEVSSLNKKLRSQTMQVDMLSEKLVARHEATDVAEENKQLKRKIELLTTATNNPDIIKTVELQEENEKLTHENKKLRFINDVLCHKLSKGEQ